MARIGLLDPTENGQPVEPLNKLRHLIVGTDEAIHQIVRAYQTHVAGLSPVGRLRRMVDIELEMVHPRIRARFTAEIAYA
jgi:hypothetical protein